MRWMESEPLPVAAGGGYAAPLAGGGVLYAGGATWHEGIKLWLDRVHIAAASGDWAPGPKLPEPSAYGPYTVVDGALEIFGGSGEKAPVYGCWRLDLRQRRWRMTGVVPHPAILARAEAIGKLVFLLGGCTDLGDPRTATGAIMARDSAGKWSKVGLLPYGPAVNAASAAAGQDILLFGGYTGRNHAEACRLDTRTLKWTRLRPLPEPVRGQSALALDPHRILLAGGYTDNGFTAATFIYDIAADRYTGAAPIPIAVAGAALVKTASHLWAIGGEDRMRSRTRLVARALLPDAA